MDTKRRIFVLHWSFLDFDTRLIDHVRDLSEHFEVTLFGPADDAEGALGSPGVYVRAVSYESDSQIGNQGSGGDYERFMQRYRRVVVKDREEVAARRTGLLGGAIGRIDARTARVARSESRWNDAMWRRRFRQSIAADVDVSNAARVARPSIDSVIENLRLGDIDALLIHDVEWLTLAGVGGLARHILVDRDQHASSPAAPAGSVELIAGKGVGTGRLVGPVTNLPDRSWTRGVPRRVIVVLPACIDTHGSAGAFEAIDHVLRFDAALQVDVLSSESSGERLELALDERFSEVDRRRISVLNGLESTGSVGLVTTGNGGRSGVFCHSCSGAHGASILEGSVGTMLLPANLGAAVALSYDPTDLSTIRQALGHAATVFLAGKRSVSEQSVESIVDVVSEVAGC